MAKIQDVTFPILGVANKLSVRVLPFEMDASTASFYYALHAVTVTTPEEGEPVTSSKLVTEGNLSMTEAEFAAWGADNSYVEEWAAEKLGLTIITE
jgi:hypothetical protein